MLMLTRKLGERILIAGGADQGGVTLTVVEITAGQVRLGFEGDREVVVDREEVARQKSDH